MKCFIASAFDYPDVDAIYDTAIAPVLSKVGIKTLRVDRVEHNDDIDDKIFYLLRSADFCIADLTYARPSVYYEAGFAAGLGKPVIFITRRDHFRARPEDTAGNLRVHFDLQMKNIIAWSKPDTAFKQRLLKRVRHVLHRLDRDAPKLVVPNPAQIKFASLSVQAQLEAVLAKGQNLLFAQRFRQQDDSALKSQHYGNLHAESPHQKLFERFGAKHLDIIKLVSRPSFTKSEFSKARHIFRWRSDDEKQINTERHILIYTSLQPVREQSLKNTLASYTPVGPGIFERFGDNFGFRPNPSKIHQLAVILGGYKSVEEFSRGFKQKLALTNL